MMKVTVSPKTGFPSIVTRTVYLEPLVYNIEKSLAVIVAFGTETDTLDVVLWYLSSPEYVMIAL